MIFSSILFFSAILTFLDEAEQDLQEMCFV